MVKKVVSQHLREHIVYPANKQKIMEACNKMEDVPKEDKEWFERDLPDRTYNNADEVIDALKDAIMYPRL